MEIPELLRSARKTAGLTQKQLAEKIGVSRAAVCQWEIGSNGVDIDNLRKAAAAMGFVVEIKFRKKRIRACV